MKKAKLTIVLFLLLAELSSAKLYTGWVKLGGNGFFAERELQSIMNTRRQRPFSSSVLEDDIENILQLYDDNGFPYCRIMPADFKVDDHGVVSFELRIDEGPRVRLKEIFFEGLKYTNPKTLKREINLSGGDYFSGAKLRSCIKKLERLSYVERIREVRLESDAEPTLAFVIFDVLEKKPGRIEGILGYVPNSGGGGGYFTSRVDLMLQDLFGSGRGAQINWYRKDPYSSELFFGYQEPWFLGYALSLGLSLNQMDYDSTYFKSGLGVKSKSNLSDRISWGLGLAWEKVVPDVAGLKVLPKSRKYSLGVQIDLDSRDDSDDPHKGTYCKVEFVYGTKSNYATPEFFPLKAIVDEIRYGLDWENFTPTFSGQCLAWSVHLKGMKSDEKLVPFAEQFKLGGPGTVRGYEEDEFAGTRVAWSNLEYEHLISSDFRVFVFIDYGYFRKLSSDPGSKVDEKISGDIWGCGFGLNIASKMGIFGIDYALGEEDKITDGKVHLGIVSHF